MTGPPLNALPDWPALMDLSTACAYVELSESSFRFLARSKGLRAVDLGIASTRYRRRDLDAMIDSLPARGADLPAEQTVAADPFDLAIEKAARRARG